MYWPREDIFVIHGLCTYPLPEETATPPENHRSAVEKEKLSQKQKKQAPIRPSISNLLSNERQCISLVLGMPACLGFLYNRPLIQLPPISAGQEPSSDSLVSKVKNLTVVLEEPVVINVSIAATASPTSCRDYNLLLIAIVPVTSHRPFHGGLW